MSTSVLKVEAAGAGEDALGQQWTSKPFILALKVIIISVDGSLLCLTCKLERHMSAMLLVLGGVFWLFRRAWREGTKKSFEYPLSEKGPKTFS